MKQESKQMIFLLITLILLALPTLTWGASETRLKLSISEKTLEIGQEVTVEVWIEDTPAMYGAENHLSFDPEILAVVDADTIKSGINVHSGSFLDPKQAFELQNQADNEAGTIDYAVTLLNPAPPVEGSGLFFNVTFRVKAAGSTTIQVNKSLFGTRDATPIDHDIENVTLQIESPEELPTSWLIAIGGAITLLLVIMIMIVWMQLRRQQQATAYYGHTLKAKHKPR